MSKTKIKEYYKNITLILYSTYFIHMYICIKMYTAYNSYKLTIKKIRHS